VKICWSNNDHEFYLNCGELYFAEKTRGISGYAKGTVNSSDRTITLESIPTVDESQLCDSYGRIGNTGSYGGKRYARFEVDKSGERSVRVWYFFGLRYSGGSDLGTIHLHDGLVMSPHIASTFREALFLSNGKEILFEARGGLYVMDIDKKKAGKLTKGTYMVVLTGTCNKRVQFLEQ